MISKLEKTNEMTTAEVVLEINDVPCEKNKDEKSSGPISYLQHLIEVSKLTYPIILSEIFQNCLPVVDIAFVGRLGKQDLAAAALATVWFNLWNSTMMGFMTAIDTLLAQSFGANHLEGFAIWTGTSLVVVFFTTIIVSGVIALCGPAMHLFGQDPELANAAGEFSYRLIPGLFPYFGFKILTKSLQTQNKLAPGVWIGILANLVNGLFNWGLIFALGWGMNGAPWATTFTRFCEFFFIVGYMYYHRNDSLKATWPRLSKENLTCAALRPFWKLSISGALSMSAEAVSLSNEICSTAVTVIVSSY
jgi:MATE family multidrug resistance protein